MNLEVINQNNQLLVDSRQVAQMVDKQHAHLMRDIKGYVEILTQSNFGFSDFFIESNYQDSTNRTLPCYLITRKGCDMVANKMTGEKGVLFTAAYVSKFEEMEKQINSTSIDVSKLSPELQMFKQIFDSVATQQLQVQQLQGEVQQTKQRVEEIKEVIVINPGNDWRATTNKLIQKIGYKLNDYEKPKKEIYEALEKRAACKLGLRLDNLMTRALKNGMAPSKVKQLNNLDVIAEDKKLIEVYIAIVKEMAIKYNIA